MRLYTHGFPGSKAFIKRPGGCREQTPQRPDDERGLPKQNNIATVAVVAFTRARSLTRSVMGLRRGVRDSFAGTHHPPSPIRNLYTSPAI